MFVFKTFNKSLIHFKSLFSIMASDTASRGLSYLSQEQAQNLDSDLMSSQGGFSIDSLMELAGLSCALVAHNEILTSHSNILVICGPGNNGGDGLVCSRHLSHFGHSVSILYPRRGNKTLYFNLITQCQSLGIPILDSVLNFTPYSLIIDAIFGFSFKGIPKEPFRSIIDKANSSGVPIFSIDVPSGFSIDGNFIDGSNWINSQYLISLTAPKQCVKEFSGRHYLGGRFVPPWIIKKYNLTLPCYQGCCQYIQLY